MVKKNLEITEYLVGKKLVKVVNVPVSPHFKQKADGTWVVDDSIPVFIEKENEGKSCLTFSVKINFTGTQRLNIFDHKEQPQKTLSVRCSVFNPYLIDFCKNLTKDSAVNMILSNLQYSAEYGYQAIVQSIFKAETVSNQYNVAWIQTFSEKMIGKSILTVNRIKLWQKKLKKDGEYIKDEAGKTIIDETAPLLIDRSTTEGLEFGSFCISPSIHKKTLASVFKEEISTDYEFRLISVSVYNNLYQRLKAFNESGKIKAYFDMDIIVTKENEYYNGNLLSFSFSPQKEENDETENKTVPSSSNSNETTTTKTTEDNLDFPSLANKEENPKSTSTENTETETKASYTISETTTNSPLPEVPDWWK